MKPNSSYPSVSLSQQVVFSLTSVLLAVGVVYGFVQQPTHTDAFYHINAANRWIKGEGLTDAYLWNYIGLPDSLPTPSHTYWMPMPTLLASVGMWLFQAPDVYAAAQFPFMILLVLLGYMTFHLAFMLDGNLRHAWVAGIIVILGGFYGRFWGTTETFTPYAVFGAACLIMLGKGMMQQHMIWFGLAGGLSAAAHLTRADGILLLFVGGIIALNRHWMRSVRLIIALVLGYLIVMMPWFVRNHMTIGRPLPLGGAQSIWYREYNDLFKYVPTATAETFFAEGLGLLVQSRWQSLSVGLGTLVAVEGIIVMTPLMFVALLRRRHERFLRPFMIYALFLHGAMTLVFAFPGYRGGLFHSSAALFPFWVTLGVIGLDDTVDWLTRYRRHWRPKQAKYIFTVGLLVIVASLTFYLGNLNRRHSQIPMLYQDVASMIPSGGRVLINDPAQFYYFTGIGGVVLPNESPDVIPHIAAKYGVDYLLIEALHSELGEPSSAAIPEPLQPILDNPPLYLQAIPISDTSARLYRIKLEGD